MMMMTTGEWRIYLAAEHSEYRWDDSKWACIVGWWRTVIRWPFSHSPHQSPRSHSLFHTGARICFVSKALIQIIRNIVISSWNSRTRNHHFWACPSVSVTEWQTNLHRRIHCFVPRRIKSQVTYRRRTEVARISYMTVCTCSVDFCPCHNDQVLPKLHICRPYPAHWHNLTPAKPQPWLHRRKREWGVAHQRLLSTEN